MTYYPVQSPYPIFNDEDGTPLEDGYIYIGEAYQNPITNPITASWDTSGLYPAAQPIRTIGGYPDRNGSPGIVYVNAGTFEDYSILVQDKHGNQIYFEQSARSAMGGYSGNSLDIISDLRAISGYDQPIYVRGHSAIADGGQGTFEWLDGAAPGTYVDDNGIAIVPTGGDGSGSWVRQYYNEIYVSWFAATGDGTTDDTIAIQSAFDILNNGDTLIFNRGTYYITSNLTLNSVNDITIIGNGAKIYHDDETLTKCLDITGCNNLKISGIVFQGVENNTWFQANTPSAELTHISLNTCNDCLLTDLIGSAKRQFIICNACNNLTIRQTNFTGFFGDLSGGVAANNNYHFSLTTKDCDYLQIDTCNANHCSGSFLSQNTGEHVNVTGCKGNDLHDSGIYISSGRYITISNCSFLNVYNAGILARVISTAILGNTIENCDGIGISVTGVYQVTPDSWGAGGNNFTIIGNSITGSGFGIRTASAYTFYPRDIVINSNVIENCTASGFFGVIAAWIDNQTAVVCNGNVIKTYSCDMGINIDGDVDGLGNKGETISVVGNSIYDGNGNAANTRGALRLVDINNFAISGNTFGDIAPGIGIRLLRCDGGSVTGNVYEGGIVVYAPAGESNTDTVFASNRGTGLVADGPNNFILQNGAPITGYPSTATTPKSIGLFTFSSGVGYVSTGTSGAGDWKQITP